MDNQAPIRMSIVVPVYNVAPYLRACMDSLIHQTLREIEIICVDDASTDGSEEILREYAAADPRIMLIRHAVNGTASQSRKDGALASRGEYVLFVDPDDVLAERCCGDLLALAARHPVDVLHFTAAVLADETLPQERVERVSKMLKPHRGALSGDRLIDACFAQEKFHFQIWNKLFRGEVCRRAMKEFPDGRFPKAQDLLALFIILYFARSYYGEETQPYYFYRLGVGVTGGTTLTHPQIEAYAHQPLVVDSIRRFLKSQGAEGAYESSVHAIDERLSQDMIARLRNHIAQEDIPYAWETMCRVLGASRLIELLAKSSRSGEGDWARYLKDIPNPRVPGQVRCIGAFYHSLHNGGAQRVAALLTKLWKEMGYRVVVFTDEPPHEDDYPYEGVRIVLPDCRASDSPEDRAERVRLIADAVKEHRIDLFVYHAWLSTTLFWDMLAAKHAGAAFYIHAHNIFSMPLLSQWIRQRFRASQAIYAHADGVICLSKTDAAYWKLFNPRVFTVVNPMFFRLDEVPVSALDGKEIIWTGRIAEEKRPVQLIDIFALVLEQVPEATLSIVGSGPQALEERVRGRAEELGVSERIAFHGFQSDVLPFYRRADVFLSTSEYEGFSLTILEAQSCGLPVVTYEMPYLTILESGKGSVSVPQGHREAAARAIVKLLTDDGYRREMGKEARENVRQNFDVDMRAQWEPILRSAEEAAPPLETTCEALMMQTLCEHMGLSRPQLYGGESIPLPKRGPLKKVRKKLATFLRCLLIEGFAPALNLIRDFIRRAIRKIGGYSGAFPKKKGKE